MYQTNLKGYVNQQKMQQKLDYYVKTAKKTPFLNFFLHIPEKSSNFAPSLTKIELPMEN